MHKHIYQLNGVWMEQYVFTTPEPSNIPVRLLASRGEAASDNVLRERLRLRTEDR
jgi:hypothetical protein